TQVNKERTQPLDYAVTLEADGGKF
ncbi:uncharacterized protein METZ01_LOCUS372041, partial [marine metagenome]